jgi:hypothetical protein
VVEVLVSEMGAAKVAALGLSASIAFSVLCYSIAISTIEDEKQNAFMMKVCIDAGGSWLLQWNNRPYCQRAK